MSTVVFDVLQTVGRGDVLSETQAETFTNALMNGEVTPVQTAGVLAAISARGEQLSEMIGFAKAMRSRCTPVSVPFEVLDTCGTGGDGGRTFNISTAVAFVCAAADVKVAKHGNRAVSSRAGSADVLEALGAKTDLTQSESIECLQNSNLGFLFAPIFHPAMRHAAEARKQLGFRTIFNIVGPLTNPLRAKHQIIGVFRPNLVPLVANTLVQLGSNHCLVVHGEDGIDEISISGRTKVAEVIHGSVREYTVVPEDAGLSRSNLSSIAGGDASTNARIIEGIFEGDRGPCRDIVALNAGAALFAANRATSISQGVELAQGVIDNGAAQQVLKRFVEATNSFCREQAVSG